MQEKEHAKTKQKRDIKQFDVHVRETAIICDYVRLHVRLCEYVGVMRNGQVCEVGSILAK